MRHRPGAVITVTLVFYCYSGAKEHTHQEGKESNLNWAKILYMNMIKFISSDQTRKCCLHRITMYVCSNQGKVLLQENGRGKSSERLESPQKK